MVYVLELLISDDRHQRLNERWFCFIYRLTPSGCQFYSVDSMNFNLEYQQVSHIDSKVSMERLETHNNPHNVKEEENWGYSNESLLYGYRKTMYYLCYKIQKQTNGRESRPQRQTHSAVYSPLTYKSW